MNQGVEGRHEEVLSRHPLAALSFGALLTFVGGRARRWSIAAGRSATPVVKQAPTVADNPPHAHRPSPSIVNRQPRAPHQVEGSTLITTLPIFRPVST
jgi:hypothetical protein